MNTRPINTAYTTSLTRGIYQRTLTGVKHINELLTIDPRNTDFKTYKKVVMVVNDAENVPPFFHPFIYIDRVYIDCRPFFNKDGDVRNIFEYGLMLRRALLDQLWLTDQDAFYPISRFVIDAFSGWVSFGLQKAAALPILVTTYFKVITAIYYLGLFNRDKIGSKEATIGYLIKEIAKITSMPATFINDVIMLDVDKILHLYEHSLSSEPYNSTAILAEALTAATNGSVHIDQGVIRNAICRGAILAANSIDITAIALEHPPTLIAMINCVSQRGIQQNTTLGKAILGVSRRHDKNTFEKFINLYTTIDMV